MLTKSVFINVSPTPIIIQQQPPVLLEIKEGEDFTISCIAHSHPKPCYQWFRDNTRLEGETSNILCVSIILTLVNISILRQNIKKKIFQIKQFTSKCEGKYYCYITNDISEVVTQRTHVMVRITYYNDYSLSYMMMIYI